MSLTTNPYLTSSPLYSWAASYYIMARSIRRHIVAESVTKVYCGSKLVGNIILDVFQQQSSFFFCHCCSCVKNTRHKVFIVLSGTLLCNNMRSELDLLAKTQQPPAINS